MAALAGQGWRVALGRRSPGIFGFGARQQVVADTDAGWTYLKEHVRTY
jgi:hypothetical protein